MGSIYLSQKKVRGQSSGWQTWTTINGTDYISQSNNAHVVYSATLSLTGASALTSVTVATNFTVNANSGSHSAVLHCYLYTSDPTTSSPTSPPSGYVAHVQVSATVPYYGLFQAFQFTGLNITSGGTLYFWFTDYNTSSYTDYCYSYATGNGVTGTPYASGTFSAATQSLTISPSSVSTGGSVNLAISNGSGGSFTATFKYGSTTLASKSWTGASMSMSCPASWFSTAGVTALSSMTVSVTVTGGSQTLTGHFTLNAGTDMKPTVASATAEIVQSDKASAFPNTYIANVSRAKITAKVSTVAGASISKVQMAYGTTTVVMSYNSSDEAYEATTLAPLTGDTVFTVTATDSRGATGSLSVTVTDVVAYTEPSAVINDAYRCDSSGEKDSGGSYYRIKVTATVYTGLSGNTLATLNVKVKGTSSATDLTSGELSSAIDGNMQAKNSYTLVVTIQDSISDAITREIILEGQLRNIVFTRSDDGTYVGIGKTPERTSGKSAVELPSGGALDVAGVIFSDEKIVLKEDTLFGDTLPSDPVEGQIFFLITS